MITIGGSVAAPVGATLRVAQEKDRDILRRLRRAGGARGALPARIEQLLRNPALGRVWLFDVHATPAGYLAVLWAAPGGAAVVDELVIVPALRGRGLGTWALDVANAACRARGIRELRIEVEQVVGAVGVCAPRGRTEVFGAQVEGGATAA